MNKLFSYTCSIQSVAAGGVTNVITANLVVHMKEFLVKSLYFDVIFQAGLANEIIPFERNDSELIGLQLVGTGQSNALALLNQVVPAGSALVTGLSPAFRIPGQYFFEGLKFTNLCTVTFQHINNDILNQYVCYCNVLIETQIL